jgi:hypothetical protein
MWNIIILQCDSLSNALMCLRELDTYSGIPLATKMMHGKVRSNKSEPSGEDTLYVGSRGKKLSVPAAYGVYQRHVSLPPGCVVIESKHTRTTATVHNAHVWFHKTL